MMRSDDDHDNDRDDDYPGPDCLISSFLLVEPREGIVRGLNRVDSPFFSLACLNRII
ncbi:MAG: hypothetical protein QGH15_19385 [Kiritimatiellia bacterium]|nr:hypothetical protein [Kiritimatiellia bacterium]